MDSGESPNISIVVNPVGKACRLLMLTAGLPATVQSIQHVKPPQMRLGLPSRERLMFKERSKVNWGSNDGG